ncbi:MAG: PorP/SprF family type IX secretion system membrane protein [Muribaculaceae bacterium]|nr:PorP/SprF family type IX secretion system membrane protein [Muribaculaceae bacterium]
MIMNRKGIRFFSTSSRYWGISRIKAAVLLLILPICMHAQEEGETPGSTYDPVVITSNPDIMLTQHWAMPTLLNPAATGEIDFIRVRGAGRLQRLGEYHNPKNFLVTADSPFKLMGKRVGAGIIANFESHDLYRNIQVSAQGSYKLNFKQNRLSIGIQIGYYHSQYKGSEYVINRIPDSDGDVSQQPGEGEGDAGNAPDEPSKDDPDEDYNEDMPTQDVAGGALDLGVGIRFEHPKFYVGLSAQHLTNPKVKLSTEGESSSESRYVESKLPMTLYFDVGGNIPIPNSLFTLQPSLILGTDFNELAGVIEMRSTYNNLVTFGVDYRYNTAFGVLAGINIKNFFLGYSWEYNYSSLGKSTTGNHELVLGYQFKMDMGGKNLFRHRSIRIM